MSQPTPTIEHKSATGATLRYNVDVADRLGLELHDATNSELDLARSHCVRAADDLEIKDADGNLVWSVPAFDFLQSSVVPDTVNPSLWAHARADRVAGLFAVVEDRIFQVRGFDVANLTLIRSATGWIVLDTMTTVETASAALEFAEEALGEPIRDRVRAVIISHSHADHFGGVGAVVAADRVGPASAGKVPIYVPAGFELESVSENLLAGPAMRRRGEYQFGTWRDAGVRACVDSGVALANATGHASFLRPTDVIEHDQTLQIDGLTIDFQLTPGTEAPAEMHSYFHDYRALWLADNCLGTLHNLYPIRGAQVRDAAVWSRSLLEAIRRYGERSDVVLLGHQWPHHNTDEEPHAVVEFITNNAAIYKFIHDQTLLYANQGLTPHEIARTLTVPDAIARNWYLRPYYGAVEFNVRAVFNRYLGFYNGNPVNLNPLSETDAARKFVEYVGGEERVLELARADFERGEYQAVAHAANQVVFANPTNQAARTLCADAFEQLGYQAESAIWRNAYLTGAQELRAKREERNSSLRNPEMLRRIPPRLLLALFGIVIDGEQAAGEDFELRLEVTAPARATESFVLHLYHGALLVSPAKAATAEAVATTERYARVSQDELAALVLGLELPATIDTNAREPLERLRGYVVDLSRFESFAIVEP